MVKTNLLKIFINTENKQKIRPHCGEIEREFVEVFSGIPQEFMFPLKNPVKHNWNRREKREGD